MVVSTAKIKKELMKEVQWICKSIDKHTGKESFSKSSLSYTRKGSIRACLGNSSYTWQQAKSFGWKCVKVEVIINEV